MSYRVIPIALRAHARLIESKRKREKKATKTTDTPGAVWYEEENRPELVLIYRIETIEKEAGGIGQKLHFGAYQARFQEELISEGLFYPDDLPGPEYNKLEEYAHSHKTGETRDRIPLPFHLLKQADFIHLLMYIGHTFQGVIVSHDIPFSISILAHGVNPIKRGFYAGGLNFYFKTYPDGKKRKIDLYGPRISIKSINPRSNFIVFRNPVIKEMRRGNGCFIDLRTLAYVFTNQDYTLTDAAEVFGVTTQAESENLIDACRAEVQTSWELYKKLMEEAKKHPVPTPPNKWYSPGSLGKAYLRAMNVHPPTLQTDSVGYNLDDIHGLAMASDYGGRAEMHLRNVTAPIALADFKSMYPTVAVLMHLWEMLTAQSVRVEDTTQETIAFLEHVTPATLFHPEAWEKLRVLVCIVPDGDFLPVRGQFWQGDNNNALGWGYLHKDKETPREIMWYMLPDIIVSKIETGKVPKIVMALRFIPDGRQENMHPVKFRDGVMIDPYRDDFFKILVEARALAKNDKSLSDTDRERLDDELKYTNNALAYGSTIELNPSETLVDVDVQAFSDHAFRAVALRFEQPGGFYFPVIGALITAGAHLMLALGIDAVREKGGLLAFDDTDSLAIIASHGAIRALVYTDHHKRKMKIPVLSFQEVGEILAKFEALNPYDRKIIPGSILRLEPENEPAGSLSFYDSQKFYDEVPGETNPDLFYYGVASKRYALFNKRGEYNALRWRSETALGQWINPVFGKDETWIDLAWHIGMDGRGFDIPAFGDVPIMSKFAVTTAGDMQAIETYNREYAHGDYRKGIKPFEIMLHPLTDRWLAPLPEKDDDDHWNYKPALLVAPYDSDLQDAMSLDYINLYSPREAWEPTFLPMGGAFRDGQYINFHPVERFANYLNVYFAHYDIKMDDAYGKPCAADTIGLLYHPEIVIDRIDYIGKEMPNPDRLDADLQDNDDEGVNVFTPDIYEGEILPVIRAAGVTKTAQASGIPAMMVTHYLQNERPGPLDLKALKMAAPNLDKNYSVYQAEVLPWIRATSTNQIMKLTGLSRRYIQYLRNDIESPGKDMLEKLITACHAPRKEKEWQDDLLPRFVKIPTPELVRLTGFSTRYINYFKNGKRQPRPETVEKLRVVIVEYEKKDL